MSAAFDFEATGGAAATVVVAMVMLILLSDFAFTFAYADEENLTRMFHSAATQ
jgi:hypothetical protein